ncbi:MAG: flippase-like domain-containing protein [Acidobacteria bacterium]|nr:flippase-like domain-containing protein [Acidobacteriota bacterium]
MKEMEQPNSRIEPKRGINVRGLVQVVIGVGALALLIFKSDTRRLLEAIKLTRIAYLPLAFLATVCVNWLMAYRWGVILKVRGHKVKTYRLLVYYLIGIFFMNFVPGGGVSGDVARLFFADRDVRDKPFVLSSLIYERLVGLFTLLLLGFGATVASRGSLPDGRAFYVGEAILALALLAASALLSARLATTLGRLAVWMSAKFKVERLGAAAARTLEAIAELRQQKRMLLTTVLLSVLIRVVWGAGCFVVAQAMSLPLSFAVVFSFISLVDMIRMLPTWGGGIGVREWALVALFAGAGIAREQALLFSLLVFAPVLLNALIGGILYTSSAGLLRPELQVPKPSPVEISRS